MQVIRFTTRLLRAAGEWYCPGVMRYSKFYVAFDEDRDPRDAYYADEAASDTARCILAILSDVEIRREPDGSGHATYRRIWGHKYGLERIFAGPRRPTIICVPRHPEVYDRIGEIDFEFKRLTWQHTGVLRSPHDIPPDEPEAPALRTRLSGGGGRFTFEQMVAHTAADDYEWGDD